MIHSMTGYAAASATLGAVSLHLELRSVNSRFLDLNFRIGDELRHCEPQLRAAITARLQRGKVDCRLQMQADAAGQEGAALRLNAALLERLAEAQADVRRRLPDAAPLAVGEILRWPGVLEETPLDEAAIVAAVEELSRRALDDFIASRAREGEKLAAVIQDRVDAMRALLQQVAPRIPAAQAAYTERLRARIREMVDAVEEDRILQEVAVFAARIDVAEELARLATHLDEVERILRTPGACGKRLDFLMQELNREANTLASKSAVTEVTQAAMELKLCIEQMREQVQNLE